MGEYSAMTRMTSVLIAGALAVLAASTAQAQARRVAIECAGLVTLTFEDPKRSFKSSATRTYIIDDESQTVELWNDVVDRSYTLCHGYDAECEFEFAPNQIFVSARNKGVGGLTAIIDRRAGTYWEYSTSMFGGAEYRLLCRPVPLPVNGVSRNKF